MSLPEVEIEYWRQCRWMLRAAWMAQELLTTFEAELGGVMLRPGTGGVFECASRVKRFGRAKRKRVFPR